MYLKSLVTLVSQFCLSFCCSVFCSSIINFKITLTSYQPSYPLHVVAAVGSHRQQESAETQDPTVIAQWSVVSDDN